MKTIEVKEGSWHYWIATFLDRPLSYGQDNICAYTRKMLIGLFLLSIFAMLAMLLLFSFGSMIAWAVACIVYFQWIEPEGFCAIGFVVTGTAATFGCFALFMHLREKNKMPKVPPIVADAWESFHDKVCFRIDVKP